MHTPRLFAAIGVLAILLTACTSPSDPELSGTLVTVHVVDTFGFPVNGAGAVDVLGGLWRSKAPSQPGQYEFRVPEGTTRYAFALACPSGLQGSAKKVQAFYLTVDEATELRVTCLATFEGSAATLDGTFDATAVGADRVDVYTAIDGDFGPGATPAGAYGPLAVPVGSPQAIVAVARDLGFGVLGVRVVRDVTAAGPVTENLVIGAGDAAGSVQMEDWSASVPSGFSPSTILSLLIEGSQLVTLEGSSNAMMPSLPTVPGMEPGDLYLVQSSASMSGPPLVIYATYQFQSELTGLDLDLPEPLASLPGVAPADLPTFTGLAPLPNEPNHRGHVLALTFPGLPGVPSGATGIDAILQVFVSEGWLGPATTFTMPDLSGIPAFPGARPLSGESVTWIASAFSSNLDTATLLTSPPLPQGYASGGLFPQYPPPIDGAVHRLGAARGTFTVP